MADVVEAMSSHRPYRAGLGIEAASSEIISKLEGFYDAQVVDACVSVLRDNGFNFTALLNMSKSVWKVGWI